ncbi:hypothetical protein BCU70_09005 [Vibrio sp. 10N.286.49.C2]|uniref:DUF924 family protein n=1 Tax=unclassified Vibrio TaxID=2614977 RepID=UPI000C85BD7C|nr:MULTISPECIES: DUF924 family protein [unclassified Vibrio]PMH27580.1 hypothetical protein BCU70_09005 [Vibrio sp. 10N.286.49.C2]PMH53006.1 hypothetical protein BCU66_15130 [Vibrio sp. 10N.286.49.B1]PMH79229.1 hypothetical protein BCU58_00465 [Vibrio sp. 10N.286.48.B7]
MMMEYKDVLSFWFEELSASDWFSGASEIDSLIADRFSHTHTIAAAGGLHSWRTNAQGRLAEIIVLDQFSRNLYRGKPGAFSSDTVALVLAQECIALGVDKDLPANERTFLYMPFMHSESLKIHEHAVRLFTDNGVESTLDFELRHKAIIEQFGRYPHRNEILGRESTSKERAFLTQPGSSF